MKKLKITGIVFIFLFIGLIIYANVRPKNILPKLKPFGLALLDLGGVKDSLILDNIQNTLYKVKGVTAVSINKEQSYAGIAHDVDVTNKEELIGVLKSSLNINATQYVSADAPAGCPVNKWKTNFNRFLNCLTF